jgi:hypothetical protein
MNRRSSLGVAFVIGASLLTVAAIVPACSGGGGQSAFGDSGTTGSGSGVNYLGTGQGTGNSGTGVNTLMGGSGTGTGTSSGSETTTSVCPAGLQCNVSCTGGKTTTVTGKVYDPAMKDPLYNVAVFVPAVPLTQLPRGVPQGADACNCGALFPSGAVTATSTAVDGSFTLSNVPVGAKVPLVLQVGKWRKVVPITVTACEDNAQTDKTLALPSTVAAGDIENNMPDIAVSTGSADSLECLLARIGVSTSEYVPGSSTAGHVHVFSGGDTSGGGHNGGGGMVGRPEATPMAGAPASSDPTSGLWATKEQLLPYDVVLLSCEGGETYNANPSAFEQYLNAGGRAFASHFHYAWFSGPLSSAGTNTYTANPDWSNLASWSAAGGGGGGLFGGAAVPGVIDTTLNGSTKPFPKGLTLSTWLDENGALGGVSGVSATELPIYQPKYNALVSATNTPSQPWITADPSANQTSNTLYFSFDTPVGASTPPGGTSPAYCGRAVFSDLHVAGNPSTMDDASQPPPASCDMVNLSPQEKALEFMLFDLSSCVVPDTMVISQDAGLPPPPPMAK